LSVVILMYVIMTFPLQTLSDTKSNLQSGFWIGGSLWWDDDYHLGEIQ